MYASKDTDRQSIARVHTNRSNRRAREGVESKPSFKSVLSNPFEVKWPIISPNVQNAVLARLTELLGDVAEFYRERRTKRRKGRHLERNVDVDEMSKDNAVDDAPSEHGHSLLHPIAPTLHPPPILHDITIGINAVTKELERLCQAPRMTISGPSRDINESKSGPSSRIRAVIICKADIDPPTLISHFPYLVAACNNVLRVSGKTIKLVTLPKGSEFTLSQAVGLPRVAVLALNDGLADDAILVALLQSAPLVVAPWLTTTVMYDKSESSLDTKKRPRTADNGLIPTHIKQLRTTAPKDMRAAKELRAKSRAQAKDKQRIAKATNPKPEDGKFWRAL